MESLNEIKTWLQESNFPTKEKQSNGHAVLFEGSGINDGYKVAETLAAETGKSLHRVNLSQVVSKYIGETEKNLQQVFEQAKQNNWILFFDEADALFGKRTNVKDSHDRYANTEANYLLQQINDYHGLVILATKQKAALDPALLRRFSSVFNFPEK